MDYPFRHKTGDTVNWEGTSYVIYQQIMALYVPKKQTFPWYGLGNDEQMQTFVYAPYIDFGDLGKVPSEYSSLGGEEDPPPEGPCPNGSQPPC